MLSDAKIKRATKTRGSARRGVGPTKRDSAATRQRILTAATVEFAAHGFSGCRIEKIVARAKCNIRMLYHHFGNKEKLYIVVLENAYSDIRRQEEELQLENLDPVDGMLRLLENTYDHFAQNDTFVALLNNENLMRGRFVLRSKKVTKMASPLRRGLDVLLRKGAAMGLFRSDVDPIQIYVTIAALSWFHLSNAYTLSAMFGRDLTEDEWRQARRNHVREVVIAYLTCGMAEGGAKRGTFK